MEIKLVRKDRRFDQYDIYARAMEAYRGGILSPRTLRDPKTSRKRILTHVEAVSWQCFLLAEDLAGSRLYGHAEAVESQRLRDRLSEVFGLLTDEQRAEIARRDQARMAREEGK
jgi:hypothetical protein